MSTTNPALINRIINTICPWQIIDTEGNSASLGICRRNRYCTAIAQRILDANKTNAMASKSLTKSKFVVVFGRTRSIPKAKEPANTDTVVNDVAKLTIDLL